MAPWVTRLGSMDVGVLAIAAWRWWLAELMAMVPAVWRASLRLQRPFAVVDVSEDEVVLGKLDGRVYSTLIRFARSDVEDGLVPPDGLGNTHAVGTRVLLRVPSCQVLRTRIDFPYAAQKKIGQLLAHEVERQSPLEPRHILYEYRVLLRDKAANRLTVELRMVKRVVIDAAVELAGRIGFVPESVALIEDDLAVPTFGLPWNRGMRFRPKAALSVASLILPVILAVAVLAVGAHRDVRERGLLANNLASVKAEAQVTEKLQSEIVTEQERLQFLPGQKSKPLAIKIIAEVTRILPDRTWLFEFELNNRELRIRGYSPAAQSLIELFDSDPMFANAHFRSPLTPGPRSDLERFDLSCDLRENSVR